MQNRILLYTVVMRDYILDSAFDIIKDVGLVFFITFCAGLLESFLLQKFSPSSEINSLSYISVVAAVISYGWVFQAVYRFPWPYTLMVAFGVWVVGSFEIALSLLSYAQWASSIVFVFATALVGCLLASILSKIGRIF
jgi:hypothetical protein